MKHPTSWHDVTVFQFQNLMEVFSRAEDDTTDIESETIAIMCNMTDAEVSNLSAGERVKIVRALAFTSELPKNEPVRFVKANGKRYRCVYDARQIKAGRYIETKHFAKEPIKNLHRLMASMVVPQKGWFFGWKDDKYDAVRHEEYANDILMAPITQVYGSVLFFCNVYKTLIVDLRHYLVIEMMRKGMSQEQAQTTYQALSSITAGTINVN